MNKNANRAASIAAVFVAVVASSGFCFAAGWGSLKGRFLVEGTPAKPTPLVINKDPEYCNQHKPVNQEVVIGKDNSLVNAVVYLRTAPGEKIEINPDYAANLKEPVVLDNHFCAFHPHIVLVRVGQTLVVKNSDDVGHNTKLELFGFNPIVPAKDKTEIKASVASALPSPVQCNIHPWMKAYLLSLPHPYMAVSGDDGTFEIKNIPAGTHEFQFWHETGYLKNLKFKGGVTDMRGRAKLTIAADQTLDLGDMKVPASRLVAR